MALTQEQYIGRDLTIVADGTKTRWLNYDITVSDNTSPNVAADDRDDRVVITTQLLSGTLTGYVSATNNGGTLPAKGDEITDLFVGAGSDSILPDISEFENIKVLSVKVSGGADPSTWELTFRSGVDN